MLDGALSGIEFFMCFHGDILLTYEGGVFRPEQRVSLPEGARLRATLRRLPDTAAAEQAMERIRAISQSGAFNSGGRRFTREDAHERR